MATYVSSQALQDTVKKTASQKVNDTEVRVVSINDEYNVAIGVLHRANTAQNGAGGGLEHAGVTEVYQSFRGAGRS